MAGLGGEIGGERRIIIVDTYPAACGMRVRWVGEIFNSGTYIWERMLLQGKHMNVGIGTWKTLGDWWRDWWVDWLYCEAAFGRLEQSKHVQRTLSFSFLTCHSFFFDCLLLHPAMHTSLSVRMSISQNQRWIESSSKNFEVNHLSWLFDKVVKVIRTTPWILAQHTTDLGSTPI